MDLYALDGAFVGQRTDTGFVYLPGPELLSITACHSGDKHQAAHSTEAATSSQSQQITF